MRNRKPNSLTGEVLPPERNSGGISRRGDVPGMVTLNELGGALNVVGRVRAWGQAKGFAAATKMLTEFERSIQAKERTLAAMEDLAIQEARLSGDNFAILMDIAEREIDLRLADVDNRLNAEHARGRRANLEAEIEETRLKRLLHKEREQLDQTLHPDQPSPRQKHAPAPEPTIKEQLTELSEQLVAKQSEYAEIEGSDEARENILLQEISMTLAEMDALRVKHQQSL